MNKKLLALSILVMGCGVGTDLPVSVSSTTQAVQLAETDGVEGIAHGARGAVFCDYKLYPDTPADSAPAIIERDRMYMAAQPGLAFKYLPLTIPSPADPYLYSGGRYLIDTEKHAEDYAHWVLNDYKLDGISFISRPYFVQTECRAYTVIGVKDFSDLRTTHVVMRTEQFQLPEGNHRGYLESRWQALTAEARARGLSSVWLVYNREDRLASFVYAADRVGPADPHVPDYTSLKALETAPSLGAHISQPGWEKTQDRTQFVWGLWFRFVAGDRGLPTIWPSSPPLPKPYSGDGLCLVSAGEDHENSPSDCPPTCGNAVADPGETSVNCPGDVR